MELLKNKLYREDIELVKSFAIDWSLLKNKSILISGATGMIASLLIDVVMSKNQEEEMNCTIYALGRNVEKAKLRFADYFGFNNFIFLECDINKEIFFLDDIKVDYIIHAASNTHPLAYANEPVSTITTNVIGTDNLFKLGIEKKIQKFVFLSTVEIYGENQTNKLEFDELDLGYIDCNSLRAGYPESKRVGEALCQAYKKQYNIDFVIIRLPRVYGPTVQSMDSKASSQFIKNGIQDKDIILKSEGLQYYSYCYVVDAVTSIFKVMLEGESGLAYNVSDEQSNVTLKRFAEIIADIANTKVVFDLPNETEKAGFSKATVAIMNSDKIRKLGWYSLVPIEEGLKRTMLILKED